MPQASFALPSDPAQIWPDAGRPSVRIAQIAGQNIGDDPKAGLEFPNHDASVTSPQDVAVIVESQNVPLNWLVRVRVTPLSGVATWYDAQHVDGDTTLSTWRAVVPVPLGVCAMQARASKP